MDSNGQPFSSPFAHLLATNYAPTRQESQQIQSILEKPAEKLEDLNSEVAQLQASLARAIARRDALHSYIEAHKALLSPFRNLPIDVVVEIFTHCLPEPFSVRSTSEAPLLLTFVCKSWRQIAWTTPRLWCSIHLYIPKLIHTADIDTHISLINARREGVQRWLERSGSMPLKISLTMSPDRIHSAIPLECPLKPRLKESKFSLVEMFMQFSSRWQDVYFQMSVDYLARIGSLVQKDVSRLECLRVYSLLADRIPTEDPENSHPLDDLLCNATSLRVINMLGEPRNPLSLRIPWCNLTEIVLHPSYDHERSFMSPNESLQIFKDCHDSLRKCSLWIRVPQVNPAEQYEGIRMTFPVLRSLQLRLVKSWEPNIPEDGGFLQAGDITPFLSTIIAPNLLELCVKTDDAAAMEICPFLPLLAQSRCQIQELHSNLPLSETAFKDCLQTTPFLSRMAITCACSDLQWRRAIYPATQNAVIRALTPTMDDIPGGQPVARVLCPLLEEVSFAYSDPTNASAMMEFIQARLRFQGLVTASGSAQVARLRRFHTTFSGRVSDDYRDPVERVRAQGLSIVWKFFDRNRKSVPDGPHTGQMIFDALRCGNDAAGVLTSYHGY